MMTSTNLPVSSWRHALRVVGWTVLGSVLLVLFGALVTWALQPSMTQVELNECGRQLFGCVRPAQWVLLLGMLSLPAGFVLLVLQYLIIGLRAPRLFTRWSPRKTGLACVIPLLGLSFLILMLFLGF